MQFIKKHIVDITAFVGIILISIGSFNFNKTVGFIATGLLLCLVAFLIERGGGTN